MRVAIDCRMLGYSGIGVYLKELLPYFCENLKEADYILFIGKESEIRKNIPEDIKNIEILNCDISPFSWKEFIKFPVKEINCCDIYYTPYINIPLGIKIPIFITIHDMIFFDMPEIATNFGVLMRKLMYRRAYKISKKIFTVSDFSRMRIEYHLGREKEIIVAYNGVSSYILNPISNEEKTEQDISENFVENIEDREYEKIGIEGIEDSSYILFIGNIKRHKGLKTLLIAYEQGVKEGLEDKLVIVGNQKNFRSRDSRIIQLLNNNKDKNIIFTGYVEDEKLKMLIKNARLLVQPSLYEGFGIPPLEAIALGTPVILSDIEVFKEIYAELSVNFFDHKDPCDLKSKLRNDYSKVDNKVVISEKYSYKNSSKIIFDELKK